MMRLLYFPWSICASTILATFLCVSFVTSEPFDFAKCEIVDSFQSRYVTSSFRSLKPGSTCESNSTSTSGQEVHVIMVNVPADKNGWLTVRLSILSRRMSNLKAIEGVDYQEQHTPLLMVLYSNAHVKWKVDIDGVSSQDKHMFTLAKGSSIKFFRKRTRLSAKSRKRDFKLGMSRSDLYHWTKSRFGGVTSFNVIADVNIQFYVGRDVNANSVCNVNSLNDSLRIFYFHDVTQPISGCVSKRRNYVIAKPVYIIEMLEPPPYSPGVTGVSLELLVYREEGEEENPNEIRNCHLVIKSEKNITWHVHSKYINGQIDIVYDADVRTTGVRFNTFGSHSDIISATGGALVEWTQDHVAPVQLYAGIRGANSIKLLIPLQSNSKAPSPRDRTTDPNHNRSPLAGAQEPKISDFQEGPVNLNDAINTTCLGGEMRVAISKKFIEVTGLDYSKISFKDPTCVPEDETDDFIILRTSFSECGTQSINFDNMTSFTNVVLIQTPPGLVSSLLEAELGSGYFEGEAGSGSNDLAAVTDDEDFGRQPLNVTVECKVPAVIIHQVDVQPDSPKCRMTLYKDHFFLRGKTEYPAPIGKDTTIFIKSVTDSETMIQTDSCWFSPSRQPYQPGVQSEYIIKHGCEQSSDTAFLDPIGALSIMEETRFKVIVRDKFKGHHSVYLHCQFYTCQKNMPNCQVNRHQRCSQMDPSGPGSRPNCGPVTLGPLEITDKEISLKPPHGYYPGSPNTLPDSTKEDNMNLSNQQRVIIEGLDSATVVGIAFAAFAIGILLTGALWFIHSHTGPVKRGVTNHREPEASGEITPNSSSPMTA